MFELYDEAETLTVSPLQLEVVSTSTSQPSIKMAPTSASSAKLSQQRLPNEIIIQIVNSVIPNALIPMAFAPWHPVTKTLYSCTLVNRTMHMPAQRLLYAKCLYIDSLDRMYKLAHSLFGSKISDQCKIFYAQNVQRIDQPPTRPKTLPYVPVLENITFLYLAPFHGIKRPTKGQHADAEDLLMRLAPRLQHLILAPARQITDESNPGFLSTFWRTLSDLHNLDRFSTTMDEFADGFGDDEPEHDEPEHDEPEHDEPEHDEPEHNEPGNDSSNEAGRMEIPKLGSLPIIMENWSKLRVFALQTASLCFVDNRRRFDGIACLDRFTLTNSDCVGDDIEKISREGDHGGRRKLALVFAIALSGEYVEYRLKGKGNGTAKDGMRVRVVELSDGSESGKINNKEGVVTWSTTPSLSGIEAFDSSREEEGVVPTFCS